MKRTETKSLAEHLGVTDPMQPEAPVVSFVEPASAEDFAATILNSKEYRESLMRRILLDELPSAVELWLLNTLHGKPVDRVEHTGKNGDPIITEVRRVIVRAAEVIEERDERKPVLTH